MICKNIQAIIEAFPDHEWERHQRERVNRHVEKCTGCRSALLAANEFDSALRQLPYPDPPSGLAERIMASTARLEEIPVATPGALSRDAGKSIAKDARRDALAWTAAFGGAAVALASQLNAWLLGRVPVIFTPSRMGPWGNLIEMPDTSLTALLLATGLCLCVVGFLASLRDTCFAKE